MKNRNVTSCLTAFHLHKHFLDGKSWCFFLCVSATHPASQPGNQHYFKLSQQCLFHSRVHWTFRNFNQGSWFCCNFKIHFIKCHKYKSNSNSDIAIESLGLGRKIDVEDGDISNQCITCHNCCWGPVCRKQPDHSLSDSRSEQTYSII